jgi:hypothetical protein
MGRYRWLAGGAVALLLAGPASGQVETDQARQVRQVRERVQAALALTPEQADLLRALRDRLQDELQSIRARVRSGEISAYEGRSQLREALRAQRQARDEVLSPRQRDLLERARGYVRELQTAVPRPPKPEELETNLVEVLELTATQQLLWEDLIARQRAELAALRELAEAPTADDIRRWRRAHRQAFEAMLTPLQRDELRRLRRRWREQQDAHLPDFDVGWGLGEDSILGDERWDELSPEME